MASQQSAQWFLIKHFSLALAVLTVFWSGGAQANIADTATTKNEQTEVLNPTADHSKTSKLIVKQLDKYHYGKASNELDDRRSSLVFDRFLKNLDPQRSFFLESDINAFEPHRETLDDSLKDGRLEVAFEIFNLRQARRLERLEYMNQALEQGLAQLDFSNLESIETDRENAPWAKNTKELDDLWRKTLENTVLSQKLSGKDLKEIEKTLKKRYKNQLARARQFNAEDAFELYINSLTQTYDPHTQYFSPRVSENFTINMSLQLQGIGAVLQIEDEYTKVVRLVAGGPADKAKQLKPADRVIGVGQGVKGEIIDVVGWRLDEVVDLIRGEKGTLVRLEIIPANAENEHQTKIISITRDTVKLEDRAAQSTTIDVANQEKTFKFGIINIPAFYVDFDALQKGDPDYRSSTSDVKDLIIQLEKENIDGLIIDLRNNGGGSLHEANSLVGLFIDTGPTVQIKHANDHVRTMKDDNPGVTYKGPVAVVVNRLSASASEIFSGAIQDYQRGLVVGERTFGKGTVQSLQPLDDHGQLKITTAKFYRISGESNQNTGVQPDISFPSLFDFDEIGESALPNALPADAIAPADYNARNNIDALKNELRAAHKKRAAVDPDFIFTKEQIEVLKEARNRATLSLDEKTRIKEKDEQEQYRLAIENKKRKAKGEKPFKNIEELKEETGDDQEPLAIDETKIEVDYVLTETANILGDLIFIADSKPDALPIKSKTAQQN